MHFFDKIRQKISFEIARLLSDKLYLSIKYRVHMGYWMDWSNPKTYNEKLQWLKVFYRRKDFSKMVDKAAAKDYVANKIGRDYIIPTIAIYDSADEIDFDKLPEKFVLKCTHDSGGLVVCPDKSKLDEKLARRKLKDALAASYVVQNREYPYASVPHKIIAETFMEEHEYGELRDFKFYCFDGVPQYLLVASGRQKKQKRFDYFDMEWNHWPVYDEGCPNNEIRPQKPKNFEEMVAVAKKLSEGIPHVRVDLYNVDGKVYFGELTFFDGSGINMYVPREYDAIFGKYLKLPKPLNDI